jgi:hypothetical protein
LARRSADELFERPAECGFGFVADFMGDSGNLGEQALGQGQIQEETGALRVPYLYARHTARQNKEDIRRHSERRWRDDSSVAVSQAGVNDLIAVKYSHTCAG